MSLMRQVMEGGRAKYMTVSLITAQLKRSQRKANAYGYLIMSEIETIEIVEKSFVENESKLKTEKDRKDV